MTAQNAKAAGRFCYTEFMENEPSTENVVYIDEYPELEKRLRLRRMAQGRLLGNKATGNLIIFPEPPDGAA